MFNLDREIFSLERDTGFVPSQAKVDSADYEDELGKTLKKEKYLFHSVSGFNMRKIMSILAHGILSQDEGCARGVSMQAFGGHNGSSNISLSTHEVLNLNGYSGEDVGVVIVPKDLKLLYPASLDHIFYERQVETSVSRKCIVAITVPSHYTDQHTLRSSTILRVCNSVLLQEGMEQLEKFYRQELNISLLSCEHLKKVFENAVEASLKGKGERKAQRQLDIALIARIKEVYKNVIGKESYSLVDIIRYHVKDTMPIYLTSGELLKDANEIST